VCQACGVDSVKVTRPPRREMHTKHPGGYSEDTQIRTGDEAATCVPPPLWTAVAPGNCAGRRGQLGMGAAAQIQLTVKAG